MFSGFWSKEHLTKFEKSEILKQPCQMIKKLHTKELELKKMAENHGEESKDYKKYIVISRLMSELNREIALFNETKSDSSTSELTLSIQLIKKMYHIVETTRKEHTEILMISRDNLRKNMNNVVYFGTMIGTLAFTPSLSLTILGQLVFLAGISPQVSSKMTAMVGLDDISPESFRLVCSFSVLLHQILLNTYKNKKSNESQDPENIEEYICPINATLMEEPMLCTLDGHTYEKQAIERWLYEHRNSPMTRKKMKDNDTVLSVLVLNRNLKSLIDKQQEKTILSDHPTESLKL